MKTIRLAAVIILAISLILFLWWRHERGPAPSTTQNILPTASTSAPATTADEQSEDEELTPAEKRRVEEILAHAKAFDAERASTKRIENKLRQTTVPLERRTLLGELRDRHYTRTEVIRVLTTYLSDPDASVRVYAAGLLYEHGSSAGKNTLLAVMQSAIAPSADTLSDAVEAAQVLNRFREVIPSDLMIELYSSRFHPSLLSVMAMQGDSKYVPFLLEAAKEELLAGNFRNLGLLGVPESYAFVRQTFESTKNERTKVAAAWAMFRTSGDRRALEYVFDLARREPTDLSGYKGGQPGCDPRCNAHALCH